MRLRLLGNIALGFVFFFQAVLGWAQPTAEFDAIGNTARCAPQVLVVDLVDQSTNTGANPAYRWRTNTVPAQTSTLANPSFVYSQPGCYEVELIVTNSLGSDTIVKPCFIEIYPQPEPGFIVDPLAACVPTTIQFTDTSVANDPGGNVDWLWILSVNNLTSTQQNPSFVVTNPNDSIDVILRVSNANGCENTKVFENVVGTRQPPLADFSVDVNSACNPPLAVNFTNDSDERGLGGLTYIWEFPGGVTPIGAATFIGFTPPTITYSADGQYDVSLIISGNGGCTDTITYENLIGIGGVTADFVSDVTEVCLGDSVTFTSTSTGGISTTAWDFGEVAGVDATGPTASYAYSSPGVYPVTIFANDQVCGDTLARNAYLTVLDTPTVGFGIDRPLDCQPGNPFFFSDSSQNSNSWNWDFGDGTTSTLQNPSHTYTSFGTFGVTLTVTNAVGCSKSLTDSISIAPPNVAFDVDEPEGCVPHDVQFTDASVSPVDPVISWEWSFGTGANPSTSTAQNPQVTFNGTGRYDVSLIIATAAGCTDTLTRNGRIRVGEPPVSTFTVDKDTVCIFESITFVADSSDSTFNYFWDFQYVSPGNFNQMPDSTTTVYPDTGLYSVALVVENIGCRDTTILQDLVFVSPPRADFTTSETLVCELPATITFSDSSIGPADQYDWYVNGQLLNSFSGPQVPAPYTITTPGTYIFQQAILNSPSGCTDTATVVVNAGNPGVDFAVTDPSGCRPHQATLTNNSVNISVSTYLLARDSIPYRNFSGGTGGSVRQVTEADTGLIDVFLIGTDQFGCMDTLFRPDQLEVFGAYAEFDRVRNPACPGELVQYLDSSSAYRASISNYLWNFSGAANNFSNIANPTNTYPNRGFYSASLFVQDSRGCVDSIARQVVISQPVVDFFAVDTSTCAGNPVQFTNTSTGIGPSYKWNFEGGDTSRLVDPAQPFFTIDSTTGSFFDVELIATDANGCSDTLLRENYIFIEPFDVRFFASDTIALCPPLSVQLFDTSFGAPVLWDWDFDGAGFALNVDSPQVGAFFQVPGLYDIQAIGTHEDGCMDTLLKEDYIFVAGPSGTYESFPREVCEGDTVCIRAETFGTFDAVILFGDGSSVNIDTTTLSGFIDTIEVCHVYTDSGKFFPQIVLTDNKGCTFTPEIQDSAIVYQRPSAAIGPDDSTGCADLVLSFRDESTPGDGIINQWNWDFGTGDSSNLQNPVYTYVGDTIFEVELQVEDDFGCRDTATTTVNVFEGAVPEFFASDTTGCSPIEISFSDSSSGSVPPSAWTWIFGDGSDTLRGVAPPVSHNYTEDGLFSVTLIISDNLGCADTLTKVDYIDLFRPEPVVTASDTLGCNPISITFYSDQTVSRRSLQTFEWCLRNVSTGDSTCFTTNAPEDSLVIDFDDPGEFEMTLTVLDSIGCPAVSDPLTIDLQERIVPDPIEIQNVTVVDAGAIEINWIPYAGGDFVEYVVYREENGALEEITRVGDQQNTSFLDQSPGLEPEVRPYCYKIGILNDCLQESDLAQTLEHCTIELSVTPIQDGLVLDWTPYVGFDVAQYEVYRADDYTPGSLQQIGLVDGSTLTYTDLETFCYDSISYRVRAIGVANSAQRSFSDLAGEVPIHFPPTEVSDIVTATVNDNVENTNQSIEVEWLDFTGYLPVEYILERSLDGSFFELLGTFDLGTRSFEDDQVAVDEFSYTYRVQVLDQCGDTSYFGNVGKSILLESRLDGETPLLNWTPYQEWEQGVRSYRVEVFDESIGDFTVVESFVPGQQTRFEDISSEFPNQYQYCYRVVAEEVQGNNAEAYSNVSCVVFPPKVAIPNAFTPNNSGPGVNDLFTIYLPRVQSAEVSIYNRWGEQVYNTTDWTQYWDGTYQNRPAPEGVYVYVISGTGFEGTEFSRTGTVTLIR